MNRLILVLPFLLLAACASSGSFPSLQPRPGEIPRVIEAPGAGERRSASRTSSSSRARPLCSHPSSPFGTRGV